MQMNDMKTKQLIRLLNEVDPSGEAYVCIDRKPIYFIELKEGYWDGSYNYLEYKNKQFTWVESTEGNKIDIHTMNLFDFVARFDGDFDKVKNHIKFKYTYTTNDKKNEFLELVKITCEEYKNIIGKINEKY